MKASSAKARVVGQEVGVVGVIASLGLVAWELRENRLVARAAAIQDLGIATSQWWGDVARDSATLRIAYPGVDPADFSPDDWRRFLANMLSVARLAETGLLQVEEGLLPASSLELLGYEGTRYWRQDPAFFCLWEHSMKGMVGAALVAHVESGPSATNVDCPDLSVPLGSGLAGR